MEWHVVGARAAQEARTLGEVGPVDQRVGETRDLLGRGRAVGVEQDDDRAGAGGQPGLERVALAAPRLEGEAEDHAVATALLRDQPRAAAPLPAGAALPGHDVLVRPDQPRHVGRAVGRMPVHQYDLMDPLRDAPKDLRDVHRLIQGRDHDADAVAAILAWQGGRRGVCRSRRLMMILGHERCGSGSQRGHTISLYFVGHGEHLNPGVCLRLVGPDGGERGEGAADRAEQPAVGRAE